MYVLCMYVMYQPMYVFHIIRMYVGSHIERTAEQCRGPRFEEQVAPAQHCGRFCDVQSAESHSQQGRYTYTSLLLEHEVPLYYNVKYVSVFTCMYVCILARYENISGCGGGSVKWDSNVLAEFNGRGLGESEESDERVLAEILRGALSHDHRRSG